MNSRLKALFTLRTATLLGVLLRLLTLPTIVSVPLWYDENFTAVLVSRPLVDLFAAAAGDVHPPLYYLLLWPLAHIPGLPLWALRLPSLVFSIAALFVFERIVQDHFYTQHMQVAAMSVYAVSSVAVYYASEARMYALLGLLVLLAVWALRERRLVLLGVVSTLILYTHNYGIFYLAALGLSELVRDLWLYRRHNFPVSPFGAWKRSGSWKPYAALALAGLTFAPWLVVLAGQMAAIQGNYWMVTLTPAQALYEFYGAFNLAGSLQDGILYQVTFFGWFFFAAAWALKNKGVDAEAWVMALAPFGLAVLGSVVWQPILLFRALTPCVPFMVLVLVRPLGSILRVYKFERVAFLLALVLIVPGTVTNTLRVYRPEHISRGWDDREVLGMLAYASQHWQAGDVVMHQGDGSWIDTALYYPNLTQVKQAECTPVRGALTNQTRLGLGMQIVDPSTLTGRIWYISEITPMTPACIAQDTAAVAGTLEPVTCMRADRLATVCLYLVEPE